LKIVKPQKIHTPTHTPHHYLCCVYFEIKHAVSGTPRDICKTKQFIPKTLRGADAQQTQFHQYGDAYLLVSAHGGSDLSRDTSGGNADDPGRRLHIGVNVNHNIRACTCINIFF
jgi:hypothetical protein